MLVRKVLLINVAFFLALCGFGQTKLGLRALSSPQFLTYYLDLNATVSRQIRKDYELNSGGLDQLSAELSGLKNAGITTIVSLRFPNDPNDAFEADRVPLLNTNDLTNSLALVDTLLMKLDGNLDYFQLQNEPLAGPGKFIDIDNNFHFGYYAIQWLDTLGKHVANTIAKHQLSIGIISPAFHDVEPALSDTPKPNPFAYIRAPGDTVQAGVVTTDFIEHYWYRALMEISGTSSDILDIHLNVDGIKSLNDNIDALDSLQHIVLGQNSSIPYSSLEWSQTKEKRDLIKNTPWMINFLDSANTSKVDINVWQAFIDTLNYDTTFIQNAFCSFNERQFVHACYAGLLQFGNDLNSEIFSTCALITNKSVTTTVPNMPFYSLFKNVQSCVVTAIEDSSHKSFPVRIFPNPTDELLNIEIKEAVNPHFMKLMNSFGIVVKMLKLRAGVNEVRLTGLPPGLYIVNIGGQANYKVVKTR